MKHISRITFDAQVMGGRPCIRGHRITVGTLVRLIAGGHSCDDILSAHPYLEQEDIAEALAFAAWRANEVDVASEHG